MGISIACEDESLKLSSANFESVEMRAVSRVSDNFHCTDVV